MGTIRVGGNGRTPRPERDVRPQRPAQLSLLRLLAQLTTSMALIGTAVAHEGPPLDRYGCHTDPGAKDYHCHEGEFRGRHFPNKSDMLRLRKDREKAQKVDRQETRRVVGLVDSTTLLLEGEERVRLIGVEPPLADDQEEIEQQAAGFLSRLTRDTLVHLVFEPANEPYGHRDRRQRLLAYVYLPDRTMVNLALIEAGFARADHVRTYGEASRFFSAEEAAQRAGRGMWAPYHPYR